MTEAGELVDVDLAQANGSEATALEMIAYAPRRVTLPPNQPQAIRVGIRPPENLPDGEYRAHLLFRAIPDAKAAGSEEKVSEGISIRIIPIYGITIPVIIRTGQLAAEVGISNAKLVTIAGRQGVSLDLERTGTRSVYGDVKITKPGSTEPIIFAGGVAVYPEINRRTLQVAPPEGFTGSLAGPATIQYIERTEEGPGRVMAQAEVVLR